MAPAPERLHFGWAMKGSQTSIWLSRIRRKSHIPGVYHFPPHPPTPQYPHPICMVQILGLKREIRIAFSQNGSIRLLSWNRNVIRNQCIRTGLDILTIQLHTFFLLSLSVSLCLSLSLSISYSPSISITTTPAWRKRFGLGLNTQSCRLSHDCLLITMGPPWK